MTQKIRSDRYVTSGSGAGLISVEVLVAPYQRDKVLSIAAELRQSHRHCKEKVEPLIHKAIVRYGARLTDNIDLEKLPDYRQRAQVVARALQDRTDARGFVLARHLLEAAGA